MANLLAGKENVHWTAIFSCLMVLGRFAWPHSYQNCPFTTRLAKAKIATWAAYFALPFLNVPQLHGVLLWVALLSFTLLPCSVLLCYTLFHSTSFYCSWHSFAVFCFIVVNVGCFALFRLVLRWCAIRDLILLCFTLLWSPLLHFALVYFASLTYDAKRTFHESEPPNDALVARATPRRPQPEKSWRASSSSSSVFTAALVTSLTSSHVWTSVNLPDEKLYTEPDDDDDFQVVENIFCLLLILVTLNGGEHAQAKA